MKHRVLNFCCNDHRNGIFAGRVDHISYEFCEGWDLLELYSVHEHGSLMAYPSDGVIKIARRKFRIVGHKEWYGNWCWNAAAMRRREAHRLLRYLFDLGTWRCESGPTRLFRWFNREEAKHG